MGLSVMLVQCDYFHRTAIRFPHDAGWKKPNAVSFDTSSFCISAPIRSISSPICQRKLIILYLIRFLTRVCVASGARFFE